MALVLLLPSTFTKKLPLQGRPVPHFGELFQEVRVLSDLHRPRIEEERLAQARFRQVPEHNQPLVDEVRDADPLAGRPLSFTARQKCRFAGSNPAQLQIAR